MQLQSNLFKTSGQVKFTGFKVGEKFDKKKKTRKKKTRKTELNVSGKEWF